MSQNAMLHAKNPSGVWRELTCTDTDLLQVSIEGAAGGVVPTVPGALTAKGYQQITSLSAAAALTVPSGATVALIQAEAQSVRWRDDGSDPTTSVGMVLSAGETLFFTGSLAAFKAIEITASAILNVSYYG